MPQKCGWQGNYVGKCGLYISGFSGIISKSEKQFLLLSLCRSDFGKDVKYCDDEWKWILSVQNHVEAQ